MSRVTAFACLLGLLTGIAAAGNPLDAAPPPVAGYTGEAQSTVAGCPYLVWRLARHPNGDVTGIFYFSDMSGVSLATGTINQVGQFRVTLTSAMGQGPVGTVTGTKSPNGKIDATMTGEACANMKLHFNPIDNLKLYNPPLHGD